MGKHEPGAFRNCAHCGKEFYVAAWQIKDTARRQGTYCSSDCKYAARSTQVGPRAEPDRKLFHSAGYVLVWKPDHPRASKGRVFEHIVLVEEKLGRLLLPDETVHHKDHNRQNNDPDNLVVLSNSAHATLHQAERRAEGKYNGVEIQCQECGISFRVKPYQAVGGNPAAQRKYCSWNCKSKSWARQMVEKRGQVLGRTETKPCLECGKAVTLEYSRRKKLWTCSLACRRRYISRSAET